MSDEHGHKEYSRKNPYSGEEEHIDASGDGGPDDEGLNEVDPDEQAEAEQDLDFEHKEAIDDALKAGEKAKKKAVTSHKRAQEAAEATVRLQQGLLRKNYQPHSRRIIALGVQPKPNAQPTTVEQATYESDQETIAKRLDQLHKDRNEARQERDDLSGRAKEAESKGRLHAARRLREQHEEMSVAIGRYERQIQAAEAQHKAAKPATKGNVPHQTNREEFRELHMLEKKQLSVQKKGNTLSHGDTERLFQLREKVEGYNLVQQPAGLNADESKQFEELKQKELKRKLSAKDRLRLEGLRKRDADQGKLPDEIEHDRLQAAIKRDFDTSPKGLREDTDIEKTIEASGHENLDAGWSSTHKFNWEQRKRKYKGLATGERVLTPGGKPPESSKITLGPNQEEVIRTTNWTPMDKKESEKGSDKFTIELGREGKSEGFNKHGAYYLTGQNLRETLNKAGIEVGDIKQVNISQEPGAKQTVPLGASAEAEMRDPNVHKPGNVGKASPMENLAKGQKAKDLRDLDALKPKVDSAGFKAGIKRQGNKFVITTPEGEHLNPEQIDYLKQVLHVNHGLKSFDSKGTIGYTRERHIVPVGAQRRLPKGVDEEDVAASTGRQTLYSGRAGVKWGEREGGQLQKGQSDRVGVRLPGKDFGVHNVPRWAAGKKIIGIKTPTEVHPRVGERVAQYHFKEDTDAIGWGLSYRPGNQEVSNIALAMPRGRRERQIWEAVEADKKGRPDKLNALVAKEHPELDTDAEKDEQKGIFRRHAHDLELAGIGSAYYTFKDRLPSRAYQKARHIDTFGIGDRVDHMGKKINADELFKDYDWAVHRPLGNKMDRAKYRFAHPLGDPNDPTMAGFTFGGADGPKAHLPLWYNRKIPIDVEDRAGRRVQRKADSLKAMVASRENIDSYLAGDKKSYYRQIQARTAVADPERRMSDDLIQRIRQERVEVENELKKPLHQLNKKRTISAEEATKYRKYLEDARGDLRDLDDYVSGKYIHGVEGAHDFSHSALQRLWGDYAEKNIPVGPLGKAAKLGLGGTAATVAAIGLGTLAVDRYQTYQHNKGAHIEHPVLDAVVPETIKAPKVSVKRSSEYKFPNNALTDALDLEGKKMPLAGRLSVSMEDKWRLRNHKDISGEAHRSGLPLLGGLGFRAPERPGHAIDGILHPTSGSEYPNQKNLYVAGKKVPIEFSTGKKERWQDRNHRLRASNNPFRLNTEDREDLVRLATTPDGTYRSDVDRYRQMYGNDEKFIDMLDDKAEIARVHGKEAKKMDKQGKNRYSSLEETKMRGSNETLDEYRDRVRQQNRARESTRGTTRRMESDQS